MVFYLYNDTTSFSPKLQATRAISLYNVVPYFFLKVTYVEYLNITWDPVLKEDQYALQGEGNRCQAGNVSASFHVQLKEEYGTH